MRFNNIQRTKFYSDIIAVNYNNIGSSVVLSAVAQTVQHIRMADISTSEQRVNCLDDIDKLLLIRDLFQTFSSFSGFHDLLGKQSFVISISETGKFINT